ncbi:MAG: hypothetical protein R3322_00195 [Kiloniellales bacterium]|nr:hypothetical protein [Kiloniellales bacterium]
MDYREPRFSPILTVVLAVAVAVLGHGYYDASADRDAAIRAKRAAEISLQRELHENSFDQVVVRDSRKRLADICDALANGKHAFADGLCHSEAAGH